MIPLNHPGDFAMCIRSLIILATLAFSGFGVPALADEPVGDTKTQSNRDWLLARYDVNGDQVISAEEISQKRDKVFGKMDLNQDGTVSFQEFTQIDEIKRQPIISARFSKLDADNNGAVSQDEYRNYQGSFKQFDLDGNGKITSEEMDAPSPVQTKASTKPRCFLWVCVRGNIKD